MRNNIQLGWLAAEMDVPSLPGYTIHDLRAWKTFSPEALLEQCRAVEVLLLGRTSPTLPAALLADRGQLRYVCHMYGTIRPYIAKAFLEAGLIVTNWGDDVAHVAEGAVALLFCLLKQLPALNAKVQGGADQRITLDYPATLDGRDVGLYGFGPIGRHAARMLTPFGAHLAIYDPYTKNVPATIRQCASLRELFASCQIISIHCGLNAQTQGSVTGELLELLPVGGIVVNTARGGIVDEPALAALVKAGRLFAGVDVIANESNWPGSPLAGLPGALLTGHVVSTTVTNGKRELSPQAARNLDAYRRNEPLNAVITAAEYDLKT